MCTTKCKAQIVLMAHHEENSRNAIRVLTIQEYKTHEDDC